MEVKVTKQEATVINNSLLRSASVARESKRYKYAKELDKLADRFDISLKKPKARAKPKARELAPETLALLEEGNIPPNLAR